MKVNNKNEFKKPLIVFTASTIEILFNVYFRQVVSSKLGNENGKVILEKYEVAGVQECLSICDAFIEEPLRKK